MELCVVITLIEFSQSPSRITGTDLVTFCLYLSVCQGDFNSFEFRSFMLSLTISADSIRVNVFKSVRWKSIPLYDLFQ